LWGCLGVGLACGWCVFEVLVMGGGGLGGGGWGVGFFFFFGFCCWWGGGFCGVGFFFLLLFFLLFFGFLCFPFKSFSIHGSSRAPPLPPLFLENTQLQYFRPYFLLFFEKGFRGITLLLLFYRPKIVLREDFRPPPRCEITCLILWETHFLSIKPSETPT